jgi:hypothetical protein
MGVDVGKVLHVVIRKICEGETLPLVFAGQLRDFEELQMLFDRYNVSSYVIDAMPETRKAIEWAMKLPGRGWICRYSPKFKEIQKDEENRIVVVDRTLVLDRVYSFYSQQRYHIPKNSPTLDHGDFYQQLMNPTRVLDKEKDRYEWVGDPDHYFHAEAYAQVAYMVRGTFAVVGLRTGLDAQAYIQAQVPEKFPMQQFAPGTPQHIIDHYKRIYEASKQADTMTATEGLGYGG